MKNTINSPPRKTCTYPRVVAGLLGVALPLFGWLIFFQGPEKVYTSLSNGGVWPPATQALPKDRSVEMASLVAVEPILNFYDHKTLGPRKQESQVSPEPMDSSSTHPKSVEKLPQAMPVPSYLIQSTSTAGPHRTQAMFAYKGELAHEHWRTTSTSLIERYQLYLDRYPNGIFVDTALDRIKELRKESKATSPVKVQHRITKAKNIRSPSKAIKPAVIADLAVASSSKVITQCGDRNSITCRQPLQILAKHCNNGTGLNADGLCVMRNYRKATVIKR